MSTSICESALFYCIKRFVFGKKYGSCHGESEKHVLYYDRIKDALEIALKLKDAKKARCILHRYACQHIQSENSDDIISDYENMYSALEDSNEFKKCSAHFGHNRMECKKKLEAGLKSAPERLLRLGTLQIRSSSKGFDFLADFFNQSKFEMERLQQNLLNKTHSFFFMY